MCGEGWSRYMGPFPSLSRKVACLGKSVHLLTRMHFFEIIPHGCLQKILLWLLAVPDNINISNQPSKTIDGKNFYRLGVYGGVREQNSQLCWFNWKQNFKENQIALEEGQLVGLGEVVVNQVADKQDQQLHKRMLFFLYMDLLNWSSMRLWHQLQKKVD